MFYTKYKDLCNSIGKTPSGVGIELGISKTTISYWKKNINVIPKQDVLLKIADYFKVSIDELLGTKKEAVKDNLKNRRY